jgi:hypothetical protein
MTIYVNNLLSATEANVTGKPTPTRTWQWLRNGTAITGANSSTYTVIEADLATNLSVSQIETNLGGVDTATSTALGPVSIFGVNSLFANGEEGAWFDPSDLSTLFQDSAGTTPVTTVGQPVGLMLDKSQGAPTLGAELLTNGTYAAGTTGWTEGANATYSVSDGILTLTNVESRSRLSQFITTVVGRTYRVVVTGYDVGNNNPTSPKIIVGATQYSLTSANLVHVATSTSTEIAIFNNSTLAGLFFSVDDVTVRELPGNHATQATSAARPTYQTSAGLHWLAFDGVNDGMATGTITPNVDKAQVFAGARKLSDASSGQIVGLSTAPSTANGSFGVFAPNTFSNVPYWSELKGTTRIYTDTGSFSSFPAPHTDVLTFIYDIGGTAAAQELKARVGGANQTLVYDGTSVGTGNFLAYPLYIGSRGTSFYFNGNMYGLITRFGANLTDAQIASTESYLATKSGVTL